MNKPDFEIEGMKFCPGCRRFMKNYGIPELTGNRFGLGKELCDWCYEKELREKTEKKVTEEK